MFYHSLWQEELVKRVHEEGASIPKYLLSHLVKHFQRLVYVKNWYLKRSISDDSKSHIMLCFGKNPCWKSRFLINQWSMAFGDLGDIWTVIEYLRLFGERFHLDYSLGAIHSPLLPWNTFNLTRRPYLKCQTTWDLQLSAWKQSCWVKTHGAWAAGFALDVFGASFHFMYIYFPYIFVYMHVCANTPTHT